MATALFAGYPRKRSVAPFRPGVNSHFGKSGASGLRLASPEAAPDSDPEPAKGACATLRLKSGEAALAESFRIRSHESMAFVILDRDGKPLADHDGKLILVGTKAEAREFVMPIDNGVVSWEWWVAKMGEDAAAKADRRMQRKAMCGRLGELAASA
jgi:hypothetical protein